MIKYLFLIVLFSRSLLFAQIANYNHFPTLKPSHILDENKTDISFAFSMRLLESDYDGPLIRLRRANDNQESDFFCGDNDIIDINAINNWRTGNNVFVVIWYDQSGLNRNATENDAGRQPQLNISDQLRPYLAGDGINDRLIVNVDIQILTNSGGNASVFGVFFATDRADFAFGSINGGGGSLNRWITHINWNDERCYFDPGSCCENGRFFSNDLPTNTTNPGSLNIWDQYSFIRRDDPLDITINRRIMRTGNIERTNTDYASNLRFSGSLNFGICAAVNNNINSTLGHSNTRIQEFIMYNNGKNNDFITEIEENQIRFWNL